MKGYKIVNRKFSTTVWPLLAMAALLCAVAPMRLEREGGSLWLSLTDRDGVKQFIQADGAAWIRW